jgi:radical SAM protein with 4Fe4S-binding SPASM domain
VSVYTWRIPCFCRTIMGNGCLSAFLEEAVAEVRNGYVSCKAGRTRLSIDCDGSVYPCNLVISDPRWAMGNIKDQRILDIWFSQKWSFFRGDVKMSDLTLCRNCKDSDKCQDLFCRLLPYLENGNPFGPHPKCR